MIDTSRSLKKSRKRGLTKMSIRPSDVDELTTSVRSASSLSSCLSTRTNKSSAGKVRNRKRRSVSFSESHGCRQIPCIASMSKREIRDVWYDDAEFDFMKQACVNVIRKIVFGCYKHHVDSIESEWRGLEKKTREGSDARKANRDWALLSILNEQKKQRKHNLPYNAEKLAEAYSKTTSATRIKALRVAAFDANLVNGPSSNRKIKELRPSEQLPETPAAVKAFRASMANGSQRSSRASMANGSQRSSRSSPPSTTATAPALPLTASIMAPLTPARPKRKPTVSYNSLVSPHEETLSHTRIMSMMSTKKALIQSA